MVLINNFSVSGDEDDSADTTAPTADFVLERDGTFTDGKAKWEIAKFAKKGSEYKVVDGKEQADMEAELLIKTWDDEAVAVLKKDVQENSKGRNKKARMN